MCDIYKTIRDPSTGIYKEKGSRFLAFACPVETEETIRIRLEELHKQYHDARHHCYAWRLGEEMERYRVNDDGEPSGSAGNPIFNQIRSRELTHILVVVVRYFGGTLLGTGGLIHAYRSAASDALERSHIITKKVYTRMELNFAYDQISRVMRLFSKYGLEPYDQHYEEGCSLRVKVWKRMAPGIVNNLGKIEGCRVKMMEEENF
jgi:uncharacterized YigZ family protein